MTRSEAYWILHEMMVETFSIDQSRALSMALQDIQFVDLMPNDTAPVVRCKDCKHFRPMRYETGICEVHSRDIVDDVFMVADDFCSYGERKE